MKKNLKYLSFIFISIILIIISMVIFGKSVNNYTQDTVFYDEKSTIDYKVYLKENNYFDAPYLDENKVYITSLINYIDIDFSYDLKLDDKRSGNYSYYIKGIMSANVSNTENDYWQKTYDLTDIKRIDYKNIDHIKFSDNIKLNYQEYNDLLLKFKEEYNLSMDGFFKVVLYVENNIDSIDSNKIAKGTVTTLEIPLTKATIEVPIKTIETNAKDKISGDIIYSDSILYDILKIFSIGVFIFGTLLISYSVFKIVRSFEKLSAYHKELKKILKTYDGIIVNVKKKCNTSKYNVINVNDFNELLDAHSEIRQPINFYEDKNKAIFTLINDNVVWRYVLEDDDYGKKS